MSAPRAGNFICAGCGHERDTLSNMTFTISGDTYCGGCASKKRRDDRLAKSQAENREITQDM